MPFLATASSVVLRDLPGIGAVDHFRIHAGLHGVEHVAAGQVDGGRAVEVEVDVGPLGGDDGLITRGTSPPAR